MLGLHCCTRFPLVAASEDYSPVAVRGLFITVASLIVAPGLQSTGSVVVIRGLSCLTACGIFPGQGFKPCPWHRQADSLPSRQGNLVRELFTLVSSWLGAEAHC